MIKSYLQAVIYRNHPVEEKEIEYALSLDLLPQLQTLRDLYQRNPQPLIQDQTARAKKRAQQIRRLLPRTFRPKVYMDFGGADGKITAEVGNLLSAAKVYCADLSSWENMHHEESRDDRVNFLPIDPQENVIPLPDCSVDFCSVLQTLHHLPNIEQSIQELYRVLKPRGYLLVREHDVVSDEVWDNINLVHYLYEVVTADVANWKYLEHSPVYHTAEKWIDMLKGFRLVTYQKAREGDVNRVFHIVLQKQ
jgi:ubiquinone/menaquinone biosynthesis C-methylase UbiE